MSRLVSFGWYVHNEFYYIDMYTKLAFTVVIYGMQYLDVSAFQTPLAMNIPALCISGAIETLKLINTGGPFTNMV